MQRELPQEIARRNSGGKVDLLDTVVLNYLPFNQHNNSVCEPLKPENYFKACNNVCWSVWVCKFSSIIGSFCL